MLGGPADFTDGEDLRDLPLGTPPPPAPRTGFLENLAGGFHRQRLLDNSVSRRNYLLEGYAPLVEALNADGGRFVNPWIFNPDDAVLGRQHGDASRALFAEIARRRRIDPGFLKGVPDAAEDYDRQLDQRAAARAGRLDETYRGAGWLGTAGHFLGAMGGGLTDPLNVMTLPIGGPGKTVLGRIAIDAGANAFSEAVQQPVLADNYRHLGLDYSMGDAARSVLFAGFMGGGFRGAIELAPLRTGARAAKTILGNGYDKAVKAAFAAAPESLRRRWFDAGTVDDRAIMEAFRSKVPDEARTGEEAAALHVMENVSELRESSPYHAGLSGEAAHAERLARAMQAVLDTTRPSARAEAMAGASRPAGPLPPAVTRGTYRPVLAPDDVIRFVINDLEGGSKVVHYGSADGGTTKYGIAAAHNPGVDVANLTEAKAMEIARRRYWFRELDTASPAAAAVAFDAGYISGPAVGRRILLRSGGDAGKALELYRAHLNRIADTVPGKAKYRHGWMARVNRLAARVGEAGPAAHLAPVGIGTEPRLRPDVFPDDGEPALHGPFGPLHHDLADNWHAAVERLRADRTGEVPGALFHDDIGEMSLVWGKDGPGGYGLAHIIEKHPEIVDGLPARVAGMEVTGRSANRVQLESPADHATVRLDWDGEEKAWLLTAYQKTKDAPAPAEDGRVDAQSGRDGSPGHGASGDIVQKAVDVKPKGPPRRSGPVHLMQAIADLGGVRDDEGHALVKSRGVPKFMLGAGTIVRRESGLSVDALGERLWDGGWFGPPSTTPRPSEADVLDLLERGVRERVYRPDDAAALASRASARAPEEQAVRDELAEAARERFGVEMDPATAEDALMRRAQGETAEGAVEAAMQAASFRDLGEPARWEEGDLPPPSDAELEALRNFDDPDGEAERIEAESLEHDFRMAAAGGDAEAGAVLESLDAEAAATASLRDCMKPGADE